MKELLKVIVGSQAHGLATPESDYDYRGVFIHTTSDILKLGGNSKTTSWLEGKDDDTSWELSHFLHMATRCNPTILEVFLAPQTWDWNGYGTELRSLFPHVWNSVDVLNAFRGYGVNQRKKFLEEKSDRPHKYAVAYLRTLFQATELLTTGSFTIKVADTEVGETLKRWKRQEFTFGEVIQTTKEWEMKVQKAFDENPNKKTNIDPVNEFLLKVRKENW